MTNLKLSQLRLDSGTQPRSKQDHATVTEYAEDMQRGDKFPPVEVVFDGVNYYLVDGYHRVAAAGQLGLLEIEANISQGTLEEAQWASFGVNARHGLRRTNEDKRRAIEAALKHGEGAGKSNAQIARHIGVDDKTVGAVREKLETTSEIPKSIFRMGADGRTINTTNIGGREEASAEIPQSDVENQDETPALSVKVLQIEQREVTRGGTTYLREKGANEPTSIPEWVFDLDHNKFYPYRALIRGVYNEGFDSPEAIQADVRYGSIYEGLRRRDFIANPALWNSRLFEALPALDAVEDAEEETAETIPTPEAVEAPPAESYWKYPWKTEEEYIQSIEDGFGPPLPEKETVSFHDRKIEKPESGPGRKIFEEIKALDGRIEKFGSSQFLNGHLHGLKLALEIIVDGKGVGTQ